MSPQPERPKDCPEATLADIVDVFADDELVETLRAVPPDEDASTSPTLLRLGVEGRAAPGWEDLVGLLGDWRAEVLAAPIPPVEPAMAHAGPRARGHRGSIRSVVAIAGAFLGLLLGSTVVSAREAEPGDLLFGVTSMVWPQEAAIAIARLDFLGDLRSAKSALETGSLRDAQAALARAEQRLGAAGAENRSSLEAQLADVRTQLANPNVAVEASDGGWTKQHTRPSARSGFSAAILAPPAESTALPEATDGGVASPSELAPEESDPASTAVDASTTDSAAPSPTADGATESGTAPESPAPSSTPAPEDTASPSTGGASSTGSVPSTADGTGTASGAPQTVPSTTASTPVPPAG